jgi:hypothetical protein
MKKYIHFDRFHGYFWPGPEALSPYFDEPDGSGWFHRRGIDSARIELQGLNGTEDKPYGRGRNDVELSLWGIPGLGVLIIYERIGPPEFRMLYSSKGDMSRIGELVESLHDTPLPVGLFIPFEKAWLAVQEFMETEGQLPTCIEWVRNHDLPPNTFPDP